MFCRWAFAAFVLAAPVRAADADLEFFESSVRPLLVQHCYACHSNQAKAVRGGLKLDSREGWATGGDSGPAIVPGKPHDSLLVKSLAYDGELRMPPKGKLPADDIAVLTAWVSRGAVDPRTATVAKPKRATPAGDHWAFQPLRTAEPPTVTDPAWNRSGIDRFVRAKLDAAGIVPNPPIDRRRLARRLSFDLTGLPLDPDRVESYVSDPAADATERLVGELLASPSYGERWARHWLDLARYAESHGYEQDYDRPHAYRYRDFVVTAFNRDLPYREFVRWQIAGDEFAPDDPQAWFATGFLGAGTHATQITANQAEKERYDELDDMVRTTGTAFLGLTVGCARCHDHKYDPVSASDYYRLASVFSKTVRSDREFDLDPEGHRRAKAAHAAGRQPLLERRERWEREHLNGRVVAWWRAGKFDLPAQTKPPAPVAKLLAELVVDPRRPLQPADWDALASWRKTLEPDWQKLQATLDAHDKAAPRKPMATVCSENVPAIRLHTQGPDFYDPVYQLKRGDPNQKGEVATPAFLPVVSRAPPERWLQPPAPTARTPERRKALALWLTDAESGAGQLAARVMVNRLWQHTFGRGLVGTPSDFGTQGDRPANPELLDYLARELIRHDWRLKPVLKQIVLSAAYGQSGDWDEGRAAKDRDNRLGWRQAPRRLEAEAIRDALLAASGTLDRTPGGPGTLDPLTHRRSLYFTVKRSKLVPALQVFDAPDSLTDQPQRSTTTVAPQALWLLNSPAARQASEALARRMRRHAASDAAAVEAGFRLALGRPASHEERTACLAFVASQKADHGDEARAWGDLAQAIVCLNEFVYVD